MQQAPFASLDRGWLRTANAHLPRIFHLTIASTLLVGRRNRHRHRAGKNSESPWDLTTFTSEYSQRWRPKICCGILAGKLAPCCFLPRSTGPEPNSVFAHSSKSRHGYACPIRTDKTRGARMSILVIRPPLHVTSPSRKISQGLAGNGGLTDLRKQLFPLPPPEYRWVPESKTRHPSPQTPLLALHPTSLSF